MKLVLAGRTERGESVAVGKVRGCAGENVKRLGHRTVHVAQKSPGCPGWRHRCGAEPRPWAFLVIDPIVDNVLFVGGALRVVGSFGKGNQPVGIKTAYTMSTPSSGAVPKL